MPPHAAPLRSLARRRFLLGSAALGAATAFGSYAGGWERHHLVVLQKTVFLRNLPAAFQDFRIVQMSDFHHRHFEEDWFLREAVDEVNRLDPDMVALTGDFITADHTTLDINLDHADICGDLLSGLKAPLRFCTLGNHDAVDRDGVTEALRRHQLTVLHNTSVPLDKRGDRIWIGGLADAYVDVPNIPATLAARKRGETVILLGHEPDFADTVHETHPVDLMLAGHTHGGQVRLPLLPPMFLPGLGQKYVHGLFDLDGMQLYVNRGLGTVHLPLRVNCPPELTVLTLKRSPEPA